MTEPSRAELDRYHQVWEQLPSLLAYVTPYQDFCTHDLPRRYHIRPLTHFLVLMSEVKF